MPSISTEIGWALLPPRNCETITSSNEKLTIRSPATITAGNRSGIVTRRNTRQRLAPEIGGRLLERRVERGQARLDDHRRIRGVEDDMAEHDRTDTERDVQLAEQHQQPEREDDLRQHDP